MRVDSNQLIAGRCVVTEYPGHGIQAQDIPATGDNGAGYLYNDIAAQGALATDELRGQILTLPAAGTFTPYEDSSFSFTGAPDGVYTFTYRGFRNGVSYGDYTVTMTVGDADPQIIGSATLPSFSMTGALDVTPEPAMLTGFVALPSFSASATMDVFPGEIQMSFSGELPSLSMTGTLIVYYSQATGDPLYIKQQLVNERRSIEERNNQPN